MLLISKQINKDTSPTDYPGIVYEAFGSFLILISKKVNKSELDELKKGLKVVSEEYRAYDPYLNKYYWSEDVLAFKDWLYMSGGVIQVVPSVKEK